MHKSLFCLSSILQCLCCVAFAHQSTKLCVLLSLCIHLRSSKLLWVSVQLVLTASCIHHKEAGNIKHIIGFWSQILWIILSRSLESWLLKDMEYETAGYIKLSHWALSVTVNVPYGCIHVWQGIYRKMQCLHNVLQLEAERGDELESNYRKGKLFLDLPQTVSVINMSNMLVLKH